MDAPAPEARMAHTPSFNRHHSNPASRLAYERPWLVVLAVLAIFAFYVASGNYSFAQSLLNSASARPQSALVNAESVPTRVAETGSASFSNQTGTLQQSDVTSATEPSLSAETSSAAAVQQAAPATTTQAVAAPAIQLQTVTTTAERWATAGIVLVTEGQQWDDATLSNVDAALSQLPISVLANLGNPDLGPLHILVNGEGRAMSGAQPYGGSANYFSTNDGVNELVLYPDQRVSTVLHELGHAYNLRATPAGRYAQVLIDPEMESFMAATGWQVLTPRDIVAQSIDHTQIAYNYTGSFMWDDLSHLDPLEDFANSFAMYYYNPTGLKASSPQRYDWFAAHLPK
jgi:hypothetical protein